MIKILNCFTLSNLILFSTELTSFSYVVVKVCQSEVLYVFSVLKEVD